MTADRYGLLAAGDLDRALTAEIAFLSGIDNGVGRDTSGYLDECKRLMDQRLASGQLARGTSHPEHALRAYAHWLFSESDVFFEKTGLGSRLFTLDEVDDILGKLLGVDDPTKAWPRPPSQIPSSGAGPSNACGGDDPARLDVVHLVGAVVTEIRRAWSSSIGEQPPVLVCDETPLDLSDLGDDLAERFAALEKRELETGS